jgi:hypothetical protein
VQSIKSPVSLILTGVLALAFIAAAGAAETLKVKVRPWMQQAISAVLGTSGHLDNRSRSQLVLPVQQNEVSADEVARVSSDDLRHWTSHYMGHEVELAGMHCNPKDQEVQCFSADGLLAVGAVLARPASAQDILRRSCTQPAEIVSTPRCVWTIRFTPDWQQDHESIHEGKVLAAKIMDLVHP